MAMKQSDAALGRVAIAYPSIAGHVVAQRFSYTLATDTAEGTIIEMAPIPPGCRVIDMVLDAADLDSGTAILLDVGIMSGEWGVKDDARTCGAEFFSGSNVGQAGGAVRPTIASAFKQAASDTARSIGIKLATDAGTAILGEIGLTVHYAA